MSSSADLGISVAKDVRIRLTLVAVADVELSGIRVGDDLVVHDRLRARHSTRLAGAWSTGKGSDWPSRVSQAFTSIKGFLFWPFRTEDGV